MKKSFFYNIVCTLSILMTFALFSGCDNLNGKFSQENNKSNKTYLKIDVASARNAARGTALPGFDISSISDFTFTIQGKGPDDSELQPLATETNPSGVYSGLTALTGASFPIQTGEWIFKLTASKDGTIFSDQISKTITIGSNTISFNLVWDETSISGTGSISFIFNFSEASNADDVKFATTELLVYNSATEEYVTSVTETSIGFDNSRITYAPSNLTAGKYQIIIRLYGDTQKEFPMFTWQEFAIVAGGQESTGYESVSSLNEVFNINWHNLELSGVTAPTTLPLKYTRFSEAYTLPVSGVSRTGAIFDGWYSDENYENKITEIPANSSGTKDIYARFIDSIYIKDGGVAYTDGVDGTRESTALDSIDSAISKIIEYAEPSVNWKIIVVGEVKGTQNIGNALNTTDHAASLKIIGKTGNTTDILNANVGDTAIENGTTLTIQTAVPVTIQNLKITGGNTTGNGGGLNLASGTETTLVNGAEIINNKASGYGTGIYNGGTLRISGSANVDVSNDVYLVSGKKITIAGALSREAYVATITPALYDDNLEILTLADTLIQTTSVEEEYGKFAVTPSEQIEYCLNSAGEIEVKKDVYVSSSSSTHSGNDTTGDGSAFKPYATLETAVTKIKALAEHNPADYVIHVSGDTNCSTVLSVNTVKTVNGEDQQVEGTLGEFTGSTLKICGTNKEQDKLKGWPTGNDGKDLLAITCPNQVTVENLTLYGLATNNCHAALYADLLADVTVKNCIITGNNQTYGTNSAGGGIYNKGKMTVSDCTITGNNSLAGAGVSNAGWMKLERCIISENGNIGNGASAGAGIYNASITSNSYDGELNIINCQIINNILGKKSLNNTTTGKSGAGIYINGGTVTIEDSEITGNTNIKPTANANALYGGGIYLRPDVNSVKLNLKGKVIIQNNTNYDGIENNVYIDRKKSTIKLVNITGSLDPDSRIGITISDEPALTSSFVFTNGINDSGLTTNQLSQVFTSDNKDYDVIFETGAEGTLARKNYSVGDLLLNDCTLVPYSENSFTTEQIEKAVGIVYALDENGAPRGILGLKNSGENEYAWAAQNTSGCEAAFSDIQIKDSLIAPSDGTAFSSYVSSGETHYLTGDLDGSDNWAYICVLDPSGTADAETNYPAFNYVNNYTSTATNLADTFYESGWYMPSATELCYISQNKVILNNVLSKLNETQLADGMYWSSTAVFEADHSLSVLVDISEGSISSHDRFAADGHICVVRSVKCIPEFTVSFNTNGGSVVPSQKVSKNIAAVSPTDPTKSGYVFDGWYTSTDGGATLSATKYNFRDSITAHTFLYAKWNWNVSVGDLLLSDGTFITYDATRTNFSTELTAGKSPVGVVYDIDATGAPRGVLGVMNSGETKYAWAKSGTTGTTTAFEDIQTSQENTEPAEGTPYFEFVISGTTYYLTGDLDGSNNWSQICAQDPSGTADAETNYPAFNYANTYAQTAGLTGDYASGWYMPSAAELYCIYSNKDTLNTVLSAVNSTSGFTANTFASDWYFSSSQFGDADFFVWGVGFSDGSFTDCDKDSDGSVCVVRAFSN
ncbi:MAG: InlB B-repeat-containing protein [Treponema sp.]|nr:InlB B-repeat-containing protein [Treponema sp.]